MPMLLPTDAWLVVAHPDDELIFAGGLFLCSPETNWHVVVAAHPHGSARAQESMAAQRALRTLGIHIGYQFLGHSDIHRHPTGGIDADRLLRQLRHMPVGADDGLFTHSLSGEYGHPAHITVGAIARRAWPAGNRSTWSFHVDRRGTAPPTDALCVRSRRLLASKRRLFRSCYPSQQMVWRSLPSLMRQTMHSAECHLRMPRA